MFWRKKPTFADASTDFQKLACRIGIERRSALRIRCPDFPISFIPKVLFEGVESQCIDISVGGCCLPASTKGHQPVGIEVELGLTWPDGSERVRARIVARVHGRVHFQFLNLSKGRHKSLKETALLASRGLVMSCHAVGVEGGPRLAAAEIWSSSMGDSVIIHADGPNFASAVFQDITYCFPCDRWPTSDKGIEISRDEANTLLIFFANFNLPTSKLEKLTAMLGRLLQPRVVP